MANIVSFSRIFYLLPANETLGPMQISLRRMINVSLSEQSFRFLFDLHLWTSEGLGATYDQRKSS